MAPHFDFDFLSSRRTFEDELAKLRKRVEDQARSLSDEKTSRREKEQRIRALEASIEELQAKERLGFLLSRVNQAAQRELLSSDTLRTRFLDTKECVAFVMSVDIRRCRPDDHHH
jgi:septal ring factor EnvC (AmiA/AmiB activator)